MNIWTVSLRYILSASACSIRDGDCLTSAAQARRNRWTAAALWAIALLLSVTDLFVGSLMHVVR